MQLLFVITESVKSKKNNTMIIEILKDKTKSCEPYVVHIWTTQTVYISDQTASFLEENKNWDLCFDSRWIRSSKNYEKLLSFAQRLSQLKSQGCNRVTIDYVNMELSFYFETLQGKEPIDL